MGHASNKENCANVSAKNTVRVISSQGDISHFKQADYIKEVRSSPVPADKDPFLTW